MKIQKKMKKIKLFLGAILLAFSAQMAPSQTQISTPYIEVTGTATMNIMPNEITVEIGIEEYYKSKLIGSDSTIVKLADIEKKVRKVLVQAGVPESQILVSEMGNYRHRELAPELLMAMRLSAVVTDFNQIDKIAEKLDRKGITSFNVVKVDNSDIDQYNQKGLNAALDAAREKAKGIAANENLTLLQPIEIVETGSNHFDTPAYSNVAFDAGSGVNSFRSIIRKYVVKVKYAFQ